MNRHDALEWAAALIDLGEARLLLSAAIPCSRAQLVTQADDVLTPAAQQSFKAWVKARHLGQPIAYLLKTREFFGLTFALDSRVLIPRHETELLVELAIQLSPPHSRLLELGTGSGAVAIALAHHRRDLSITAIDKDADALECARINAQTHDVAISFRLSNWGEALMSEAPDNAPFAMMISNPPYIAAHDRHLSQGDCRFEPKHALTDGSSDGLGAIKKIIDFAHTHSAKKLSTRILLEHGFDQAPTVRQLLQQHQAQEVQSWRDLAGIERVTGGIFHATT